MTVTPPLPVRNTFYKASPYTDRVYRNSQKQCFPVSCATQRYFLFYTIKKKGKTNGRVGSEALTVSMTAATTTVASFVTLVQ